MILGGGLEGTGTSCSEESTTGGNLFSLTKDRLGGRTGGSREGGATSSSSLLGLEGRGGGAP